MTEAVMVESTATAEQRTAAESMGWIPPERFKGDPERYIDAAEYIDRGEKVLPIIKENNKRLCTRRLECNGGRPRYGAKVD